MGIKFEKGLLAVQKNNYVVKIVNAYIVYHIETCTRNPTNNFKFKSCLFGATNTVKNSDKEMWMYSEYWIIFDVAGLWDFAHDFAKNVLIFDVDNSSSKLSLMPKVCSSPNTKKLVLGEAQI